MASRLTINTNSLNVPWQLGTQYRIALDADIVKEVGNNRSGNPAVNNLSTFTTNATVPTLSSSSPADSAFDVENNTSILMTFSRNVEAGVGNIRLYQVEVGGADTLLYTYNMGDPAYVTFSTNTVTLKTTGLLEADSAYYLIIDSTAIRDIDNFTYVGSRAAKTVTATGNAAANNAVVKWTGVDSIQFDGVGDYLSVPSSADFGYGTGSFQIEAWIRPTTTSQTSVIVDHRPTATEGLYPTLRLQSGVLQYYTNSAVRITGTTITPNTWTFVQVARFAGTTRLYVNGVQVGSDYTDSNTYPTAAVKIGVNGVDLSAGFTGYMSDIRILKAPIGLQGMPTRSRTNDAYTVLYVQGGVGDVNSTIFFDTQEEALGFPSLSANLTGAFTPVMSINYTTRGQIVMASTVNCTVNVKKTMSGVCVMNNQFNATVSANYVAVIASNVGAAFASTITGSKQVSGNSTFNTTFTHQFKIGYFLNTSPWFGAIDQQNALEQNYITQSDLNNMPVGVVELSPTVSTNQFVHYTAINQIVRGSSDNFILYINKIVDSSNSFAGSLEIKYDNGNTITASQPTITINNPDSANGEKYFGNYVYVDFATHRLITSGINKTWIFNLNTGALLQTYTNPIQYNLSTFDWTQGAGSIREHFGRSTHKDNLVSIIQADQNSPYNTKVKIYNYAGTLQTDLTVSDIEQGGDNEPTFIATILTNTRFAVSSYTVNIPNPSVFDQDIVWTHKIYDLSNTVIQTITGPTFTIPASYAYLRLYRQPLQEQTTASVSGRIFVLGPHTINSFTVSPSPIAIELSQYYVNTSL